MTEYYRHFNVPYRSQWGEPALNGKIIDGQLDPCDDPTWRDSGFPDKDTYRFWSRRVCGLACLESILDAAQIPHGTRYEMLVEATACGVYVRESGTSVKGLIYHPFSRWVRGKFQLDVAIYDGIPLKEVVDSISPTCMAIASVSPEIRHPDRPNRRQGGHLVLIHGTDRRHIWFHNPSGTSPYQQDACLAVDTAERFHAKRGMIVRLPASASFTRPLPAPPLAT